MYIVSTHYALFNNLGLGRVHVTSTQYIKIRCEAHKKDSHDDQFTDLDGAEVDDLGCLEDLRISNNIAEVEVPRNGTLKQLANLHLTLQSFCLLTSLHFHVGVHQLE